MKRRNTSGSKWRGQLKASEDELKALQEKRDAEARQWDKEAKSAQLKMHQELMQLIIASMLTKKNSAMALVIGSSLKVEPGFVANIALNVAPSTEVEPHVDLHMCKVFKSPLRPP